MSDSRPSDSELETTALDAVHREMGAVMVPFAGYRMPVQYATGVLKEHQHTRSQAGLFDVSHMGQATLRGVEAAAALETLVPADILGLSAGAMRYTLLTHDAGGILDDLMVSHFGDFLHLVVNACRKHQDFARIRQAIGDRAELEVHADRALLALQGPAAAEVFVRLAPGAHQMPFMTAQTMRVRDIDCWVSRSGYCGEDGYEISVPAEDAQRMFRWLLEQDEVLPVGLGARDSLRLEAGLCLYGSDIDETTTPVEAALSWTIGARRRADAGFPGAEVILRQIADGPPRRRVGIRPEGRASARAHTEITDLEGVTVGAITSGGYGPSIGGPVSMGYVRSDLAAPDTPLRLIVRGVPLPARVVKLPFIEHRYFKR